MGRQTSVIVSFTICVAFMLCPLWVLAQKHTTDSLLEALKTIKPDTGKVIILYSLSSVLPCSDSVGKLDYGTQALILAQSIGWGKGQMEANVRIGDFYAACAHNYLNAISYYNKSVQIAKAIRAIDDEAYSLSDIALAYFNYGHYREALDYYQQCLRLNTGFSTLLSIYPNMGNVYDKLGDFPKAINCYENAANILTQYLITSNKGAMDDTLTLMGLRMAMGDLYIKTSQPDKAISNYNQIIAFGNAQKNMTSVYNQFILWGYSGLGKSYHLKKQDSLSVACFRIALAKSRELNMTQEEADIMNELGNLFLEKGNIDTAARYAQQSLAITLGNNSKGEKDSVRLPSVYITMAKIYSFKRKYYKAISYLNAAINICVYTGDRNTEKDALLALSFIYDSLKQPGMAFRTYRQYIAIKDSLFSQEKAREMTRLDMQGEFDRKQISDSLKAEKQEKMAAVRFQRQRGVLWATVFFSAFVVVIIVLVYANYKKVSVLHRKVSIQKTELEKSNREKGRIMRIVAHDLRNPVGAIAYVSEMMMMDGRTEKEIATSLKMINDTSQSSLSLINELSGFDDDATVEEKLPEDINAIVAASVALLEFKAAEKQQTILTRFPPHAITAPVVKEKISRVINNLLSNAIKFSKEHQVIEVSVVRELNSVLIMVKDNGIGIPEKMKEELFEIFTSAKRFGTNGEKPFGLGLYICRQLVLSNGGTISFESKENEGTTFYVRLPLKG